MVSAIEEKARFSSRQNVRGETLLAFTLQLSQHISAGVPLYDSSPRYRRAIPRGKIPPHLSSAYAKQIKSGVPLSEAMAQYPESFDRLYCAMVKAGEQVGALDLIFERLVEFFA